MSRSHLPVELIEEIIEALVVPKASVLQYGTPSTILVDTFRQLCLVNRFMHHISTPLLYSTIAIRNTRQHNALIYTLHRHHSWGDFTRDLWLELPGATELLHNLLYLLGPGLRRLAITDITARRLSNMRYVADALRAHCRGVTDFEHMQYLLAHENTPSVHPVTICWPYMQKLRRLALDHAYIDRRFVRYIRMMSRLDQLVLLNPKWDGRDTDIFRRFLKGDGGLQSLHLVFLGAGSVIPSVTFIVDKMAELRLAFGSIQGVSGMYTVAIIGDDERAAMEYTHSLISCGDIWDLPSGFIEIEEKMVNISGL